MRTHTFLGLASIVATLGVGLTACFSSETPEHHDNTDSCGVQSSEHETTSESGDSALDGSCMFFCSSVSEIAVGGTETMSATSLIASPLASDGSKTRRSFTVASSDPTRLLIVSQTPVCTGVTSAVSIELKALAAGDVKVLVNDADGKQVDAIAVTLRDVATMTVERVNVGPVTAGTPVNVEIGKMLSLSASLLGASGEPLYALESIAWAVSDLKVLGFDAFLSVPDSDNIAHNNFIALNALTAGTAEITVEHAGMKQTITVNVVPVSGT